MKKIISILCVAFIAFPQSTTIAHAEDLPPLRFETLEDYGYHLVVNTWNEAEWEAFWKIINKESGWRVTGEHYKDSKAYTTDTQKFIDLGITVHQDEKGYYVISSAHGLMGFINGTWSTVGCEKTNDGFKQLECGVKYIQKNYGTPTQALAHHNRVGHY